MKSSRLTPFGPALPGRTGCPMRRARRPWPRPVWARRGRWLGRHVARSPSLPYSSSVARPALRTATYQDVLDAPPHKVAEVVFGVLHVSPRPATPHALATTVLGHELGSRFHRGGGGPDHPGGWILLDEPELHLGADILVPDLAGWRREHMPAMPIAPFLTLAPDWICETLSPSTSGLDRIDKLAIYARESVAHAWLIDPQPRTLEVLRLEGGQWRLVGAHRGDARVRAEPFDAVELDLALLWSDLAGA